jgi:hypothetical protein
MKPCEEVEDRLPDCRLPRRQPRLTLNLFAVWFTRVDNGKYNCERSIQEEVRNPGRKRAFTKPHKEMRMLQVHLLHGESAQPLHGLP